MTAHGLLGLVKRSQLLFHRYNLLGSRFGGTVIGGSRREAGQCLENLFRGET